jgi:F-type H+-transporting ATPase subunit b
VKRFPLKTILPALLFAALLLTPATGIFAQNVAGNPRLIAMQTGTASTPEARSPEKNQSEKDENDAYRKSPAVRALGAKLGLNVDQSATAFEVFNFVVLAILLGWFLAKALPKTFRNRNTLIQKHLVDARTATEEANARLGNVEARLGKLDGQIAEMRAQAEKDSALDEQRIKASVEEEKQKILAAAEQEIAAATVHAHRQLQQYAAELAVEQAARTLVINADTDRLLVQDFARRLSNDKAGQN